MGETSRRQGRRKASSEGGQGQRGCSAIDELESNGIFIKGRVK
jgi:hypothetical protein